jgi:LemA protein
MGKILILVVAAVVVILLLLGVAAIGSYNSLVAKREEVNSRWSAVETNLQRRADLVGNLVGAVQGSLTQEQVVFGDIAAARAGVYKAVQGGSKEDVIAADNQLGAALDRLNFVSIVENYPQLRSNENIRDLMTQLEGTENRIAVARQDYNNAVRDYNVSRRTFPTSLIAGLLGFGEETEYFEASPGSREAPKVEFKDPRSAPAPAPGR